MHYSPLRYPGGKSRLAKLIGEVCIQNKIHGHYIEPYAGGSSVALHLLLQNKVKQITLNDFDRSVYAFWHSVLYQTEKLCQLIEDVDINIPNWEKAKALQAKKGQADLLQLGFSTLFLNRTNRSGILKAGVIGGKNQIGKYKIGCRFNKFDLKRRIQRIASQRNKINLSNLDAIDLVEKFCPQSQKEMPIFYFDPPYYLKGSSLYAHHYHHEDHKRLSEVLSKIKGAYWVLSYDDTPEIKKLYHWVAPSQQKEYTLFHRAFTSRQGKERLFFSENLDVFSLSTRKHIISNANNGCKE